MTDTPNVPPPSDPTTGHVTTGADMAGTERPDTERPDTGTRDAEVPSVPGAIAATSPVPVGSAPDTRPMPTPPGAQTGSYRPASHRPAPYGPTGEPTHLTGPNVGAVLAGLVCIVVGALTVTSIATGLVVDWGRVAPGLFTGLGALLVVVGLTAIVRRRRSDTAAAGRGAGAHRGGTPDGPTGPDTLNRTADPTR